MKDFQGYGVYGIYSNSILLYVGMTMRTFESRIREHQMNVRNVNDTSSQQQYLYKAIRQAEAAGIDITFSTLVNIPEEKKISKLQIESMEYACIKVLKPKYNYLGVKKPYLFNNKRELD